MPPTIRVPPATTTSAPATSAATRRDEEVAANNHSDYARDHGEYDHLYDTTGSAAIAAAHPAHLTLTGTSSSSAAAAARARSRSSSRSTSTSRSASSLNLHTPRIVATPVSTGLTCSSEFGWQHTDDLDLDLDLGNVAPSSAPSPADGTRSATPTPSSSSSSSTPTTPALTSTDRRALAADELRAAIADSTAMIDPPQIVVVAEPPHVLAARSAAGFLGFTMLAVSAFFFSIMSLFVSLTQKRVDSIELVWVRSLIQAVCSMIVLKYNNIPFWGPPEKRGWLIARGSCGMVSLSCFYYALTHMPLSEATVLFFTSPVFTIMFGRLVLKETFTMFDSVAMAISLVGVVLVSRPAFIFVDDDDVDSSTSGSASQHTMAGTVALIGAVVSSWVYICIRKVGKGVHPLVLVNYMGVIGAVVTPLALTWTTWEWPVGNDIVYTLCVGFAAFAGQVLFNAGVQREKAGLSAMIRNLDVVFAFFWQITVERQLPYTLSVIGAFIITSCVVSMATRKWYHDRQLAQSTAAVVTTAAAAAAAALNSGRVEVSSTLSSRGDADDRAEVELSEDRVELPPQSSPSSSLSPSPLSHANGMSAVEMVPLKSSVEEDEHDRRPANGNGNGNGNGTSAALSREDVRQQMHDAIAQGLDRAIGFDTMPVSKPMVLP